MFGKCFHYALATLFDLYAGLSNATVTVSPNGGLLDLGGEDQPLLCNYPQLGSSPVLVHGFITGRSGELSGKKFGHAWIEGNGVVLDCGSAEKLHALVPLEKYYEFWRIKPHECHRYTPQQATRHIIATGSISGWDPAPADAITVEIRQRVEPAGRQHGPDDQLTEPIDGATISMRLPS